MHACAHHVHSFRHVVSYVVLRCAYSSPYQLRQVALFAFLCPSVSGQSCGVVAMLGAGLCWVFAMQCNAMFATKPVPLYYLFNG